VVLDVMKSRLGGALGGVGSGFVDDGTRCRSGC
jgi:hypothetical protein